MIMNGVFFAPKWLSPPTKLELPENEVHVWRALLDLNTTLYSQLEAVLSEDERARAALLRFESDRKHFVTARGILRTLLSQYFNEPGTTIEFCYGAAGKPALRLQDSVMPAFFNLSHSCGLALFAVSKSREVGIDVEKIRSDFETQEIAERFFTAQEVAEIRTLPHKLRSCAFFLCWTRKEAYLKARGAGLRIPLDSFSVSLAPGPSTILRSEDAHRWNLYSFEPMSGFVATVAAEGEKWLLRHWEWA